MSRFAALILFALGLLAAAPARVAEAHLPPPAFLTMEIEDEQTTVNLTLQFGVFRDWFEMKPTRVPRKQVRRHGLPAERLPTERVPEEGAPKDGAPEDGAIDAALRARLEGSMAQWLRVQVDGLPATGGLGEVFAEEFEDHLITWRYVKLRMVFPTQLPPKQVAFAWTRYADGTNYFFDEIDAELDAYGKSSYPLFRKNEPEYIWHRPRDVVKPAPMVLPRPRKPAGLSLPVASVALVLGLLVAAVILRRRLPRGALAAALILGALAAVPLRHLAEIEVPLPWNTGLERPPDTEALAIFASLHRGVYAALGGETEDEVYDDLAASVTGELLPRLYMDINESMILHKEGGAVAKVKKTEIVDASVLPEHEAGAAWFKVHARWRVEGKVGHWGHTHQRINEYLADVTVIAFEGHWKIAGIEVLDETRIDDGKPVARGK